MYLYLAGPMRGYHRHNFDAFHAAAKLLRSHRHTVFNPAERDEQDGFDPDYPIEDQDFAVENAMRDDLQWLVTDAEGIALLPGWEESSGACLERRVAEAIGLPVFLVSDTAPDGLILAPVWERPR